MKFTTTEIAGLVCIEPEPYSDQRGQFYRTFEREEFLMHGFELNFIQHNHASNYSKGTWRGLHFQYPPYAEIKLIRCIRGSIWDVVVDLRKDSSTFLKWKSFELSAENKVMLLVPSGMAHGYITLENQSELIYLHTSTYQPNSEGGIRYDDPLLKLQLPIPIEVVSDRDRSYSFLETDYKGLEL
ncbi:MAG TPA: dTDP-4-dehydrorhamnose 3,5-epimerase [Bacteroidia bacterium]|nr:dTDP-4-dehydrorhamnose 3,5-epimerase [Bacteroidia bacterium]